MSSSSNPRLLLVDGHAFAYRAFHAIRRLNSPTGEPTNAIFGFCKMLLKLRATYQPTHLLVVFDAGLDAERMAMLPAYKSNRPPTPDDLEKQFPELDEWLQAAGWSYHRQEGAEADDWIATVARRAEAAEWEVLIATADKDFLQLVSDRIGLLNPNDKVDRIWKSAEVVEKTGVSPHQIVDWLSLIGDAVDEIPGIPSVGPKTATEWLQRFGSIEELVKRTREIKSESQRSKLEAHLEILPRNQFMIRLRDQLVGGPKLSNLIPTAPDKPRLRELYRRWGFKSLLAELGPEDGTVIQGELL